jgi:hypothetical protein
MTPKQAVNPRANCLHLGCSCSSMGGYCSEMCKVAAIEVREGRCSCEHVTCRNSDEHSNVIRASDKAASSSRSIIDAAHRHIRQSKDIDRMTASIKGNRVCIDASEARPS